MNVILIAALIACPPSSIGRSIHLSVIRPSIELSITRPVTWAPVINRIAYIEVVPPATTAPPAYDVAPPPVMRSGTAPVIRYSTAPVIGYSHMRLDAVAGQTGAQRRHANKAAIHARKAVKHTEKAAYWASRS